jgi:[ribosomal protein S5]-alanine N-acetyltransferase
MIETDRLILRPFEPDDLEAYAAIRSRPANARFLPGGEAGASDAGDRVRANGTPWGLAAWNAGGFAPWAVIEKSSTRLIGHLGLRYLPEIDETELLYLIDEPWWGKGFATEGGHAAVRFARDRLGARRLVAFALPENGASIAVMRKLGFRFDGKQSIFGLDAERYVLDLAPKT